MARTVFITGAYGALGAWVARACLERGDHVVVLRRDEVPASALVLDGIQDRCTVVHGDLLTAGLLERVLAEHEVDTVFHLAAHSVVGTAQRSPLSAFETNVRGTWLVMEACRLLEIPRVVIASSIKAYGTNGSRAFREDDALHGRQVYEVSKAAADSIARSYWDGYGVRVAAARLANVYGGGDLNRSRLVPDVLAAVLADRPPVIRSDGSPQRDFLYVEDAAAAYLAIADALDRDDDTACGAAFNAGGEPHSVNEIVDTILRLAGVDLQPEILGTPLPEGTSDRLSLDSSRLRDLTGWRPEIGLEEGLRRTLRWYRTHPLALDLSYTRTHGRSLQVGRDQAQEGDRRRAPRQAVHEARASDHGRGEGGRRRP
ncbi:NAD-dependent epimerase/dehydratase family protein [Svornostia abyssi]|uniref:NAD-dependent epimerase/dehydratase family protein n=1 Tax=Svornostia abyssi TaxID=2898438 RepID=A0ABY5PD70_9ACTN|nr:NAD-dependent epimerase/dehydratase family protein [Parviterribacteraceae bacterium J379]